MSQPIVWWNSRSADGAALADSGVVHKNSRRAPVGSCGHRLETILVVQSAENRRRDDSTTFTNLMAVGE